MARKKVEEVQVEEAQTEELKEKFKVEVLDSDTLINCHSLKPGTIVELTAEEIDSHRRHGLRLGDVKPDDDREVFDVTQPVNTEEV